MKRLGSRLSRGWKKAGARAGDATTTRIQRILPANVGRIFLLFFASGLPESGSRGIRSEPVAARRRNAGTEGTTASAFRLGKQCRKQNQIRSNCTPWSRPPGCSSTLQISCASPSPHRCQKRQFRQDCAHASTSRSGTRRARAIRSISSRRFGASWRSSRFFRCNLSSR